MSTFLTRIPVDLQSAKSALPEDSDVEAVRWNGLEVELVWSNRNMLTQFTYPVEWPLDKLQNDERPGAVQVRIPKPIKGIVLTATPKDVDEKARRVRKHGAK